MAEDIQNWAAKIAKSDRTAFDSLFRKLYPVLVNFACRYVRQKSIAADIVQESFVKLWEKRDTLNENGSVKAYLYRTVRNRCLNYKRDHAKEIVGLDDGLPQLADNKTESENNTGAELNMKLIKRWIDELPDRQREAFQLSRFEGLDHEEVAGVMEVSPNTVNNHIVAALDKLRARYNNYKKEKKEV